MAKRTYESSSRWLKRKIHHWKVLEQIDGWTFLCRCDCGTIKRVKLSNLRYDKSKQCLDCSKKQKIRQTIEKHERAIKELKKKLV